MNDLISRQAAIDAYGDYYVEEGTDDGFIGTVKQLLEGLPSAQPETHDKRTETHACDLISRQAAIDEVVNWLKDRMTDVKNGKPLTDRLKDLPSAQPEHLTDDDFETIRIHLSAYKEQLSNQHRWEEAEEYQRIIDRFMRFASAQPEPFVDADKLKRCRFEYINACKIVACPTPDTSKNDIYDANAVIKALYPIFGDAEF